MILVTGGTGLLGSHILFELLNKGEKVRALFRNSESIEKTRKIFSYYTGQADELVGKIEWVQGDICDRATLQKAFAGVTKVYHCAAYVSFNPANADLMTEINISGTKNIVDLCLAKGIKKMVHTSSIAAIGKPVLGEEYTEESGLPESFNSNYSFTKTQSEKVVWAGIEKGLNAVIVNPSVILGPGNWQEGSGKFFSQVYKGMFFYTRGVTGFVDVRDVAKTMSFLMESTVSAERFILNAENRAYRDVFDSVAKQLKVKAPKYYAPPLLTSLAWRVAKLMSRFSRRDPVLTRSSARTAHDKQYYNSDKIKAIIPFGFRSVEGTIKDTAGLFLSDLIG